MVITEIAPSQTPLDIETVSLFLSAVNMEAKSLGLGALPLDRLVSDTVPFQAIMVDAGGASMHPVTRPQFSDTLAKLPEGLVEANASESGVGRDLKKTIAGSMATALGGHLLNLSVDSSRSTRRVAGEVIPPRPLPDGTTSMSTIEARLVTFGVLDKLAGSRFVGSDVLQDEFDAYGVNKRVALRHLTALSKDRIVEVREGRRMGANVLHKYRIRPGTEEDYMAPAELIERYLDIVGRFAQIDTDFLGEGVGHIERISADKEMVPFLVKRSFVATPHTGKHTPHIHVNSNERSE